MTQNNALEDATPAETAALMGLAGMLSEGIAWTLIAAHKEQIIKALYPVLADQLPEDVAEDLFKLLTKALPDILSNRLAEALVKPLAEDLGGLILGTTLLEEVHQALSAQAATA